MVHPQLSTLKVNTYVILFLFLSFEVIGGRGRRGWEGLEVGNDRMMMNRHLSSHQHRIRESRMIW